MYQPNFTITNIINNALLGIERARGFLEATKFKEDWIKSMQSEALILEAHHSTHIEGTRLTLSQAQEILKGRAVKGVRKADRQELLNYREAMDFVSEHLGKKTDITENLIKEIHKILVKDVRGGKYEPGRYRKVQNYIVNSVTEEVIYTPPSPDKVHSLMKEFVIWLNKDTNISPVLKAGISQHQFVEIHPFLDGNGRTARLLCTLVLYQNGYDFKRLFSLSEYYDKNRQGYYNAIQSVRESDMDLSGWLEYFTEGLRIQLMEVKVKGENAIKKDVLVGRMREYDLKSRQKRALEYLIEHHSIDNSIYQEICNTTKRTATRDLTNLLELGLIEKHGEKKATFYTLKLFKGQR